MPTSKKNNWLPSIITAVVMAICLGGFSLYVHGNIKEMSNKIIKIESKDELQDKLLSNDVVHMQKDIDSVRKDVEKIEKKLEEIKDMISRMLAHHGEPTRVP